MRKYLSFFRIRFTNTLQYRSAALAGIATQFAWGTMLILMYKAFYEGGTASQPMSFPQLCSYIWLQQAFLALFNFYYFDQEIIESISSGSVAYELLRPVGLYNMWFVKGAATRLARTVLRCAPILLVAVFLPAPYNLAAPASPTAFFLFLLTMALGGILVITVVQLVYITTFHTLNSAGIRILVMALAEFMAGGVIPLPLFPDGIRQVVELSPFGGAQNLPFRIYSGNAAGTEMLVLIMAQVFWVFALGLVGRMWMKRSLRRVVIQGG